MAFIFVSPVVLGRMAPSHQPKRLIDIDKVFSMVPMGEHITVPKGATRLMDAQGKEMMIISESLEQIVKLMQEEAI